MFLPILFILGIGLINISIVFLNLIFFIHVFLNKNYEFLKKNRDLLFLILAYVIYQIFNNIYNDNYIYFIKSITYVRFLTLPLIFLYFSTYSNFNYEKLSKFYFIILLFLIADLLFQYIFEFNIFGFKPGLYNYHLEIYERYAGMFNQELVMGAFLSSIGLFSVFFYFTFNSSKQIILYFILSLLFIGIFLTGERASILSFAITTFFILFFCKEYRKNFIILFIFFLTISSIGIYNSEQLKLRYIDYPLRVISQNEGESENVWTKTDNFKVNLVEIPTQFMEKTHWGAHYKTAFKMIETKPINGYGFKQFRIKCRDYEYLFTEKFKLEASVNDGCSTHPHNYVLEILSEQGIIGFIIIFSIIIISLRKSYNFNKNKIFWLVTFAILLGYLFPFKPTGSIFSSWFSAIFWFILGFSFVKKKIIK